MDAKGVNVSLASSEEAAVEAARIRVIAVILPTAGYCRMLFIYNIN